MKHSSGGISTGRVPWLVTVALATALSFVAAAQDREFVPVTDAVLANPSPSDWLAWRGTTKSLGYSPLDQINRNNVGQLQLAWAWALEPGSSEPAPLVHDGIMYVPSPGAIVHALDAASGDLLWEYRHQFPDGRRPTGPVRALSIYDDKIFLNAGLELVALDARSGRMAWKAIVADSGSGMSLTAGSIAARGKVIVGLGGCATFVENKCAVVAYATQTGREVWRFHTIPKPGEPGADTWGDLPYLYRAGTGMWTPASYDPELNLVYWSTSQAKPWTRAQRGTDGDALYSSSTLALDVDTGRLVWHRQWLPGESHDLDEVYESVLIDVGDRKSLFRMGKIGVLWEVDRRTGAMRRASDLGYQNLIDVDPRSGAVSYRVGKLPKLHEPLDQCPSMSGVRNWPSMAFHPGTQALYVPIIRACAVHTWLPVDRKPGGGRPGEGLGIHEEYLHPVSNGKLAALVAMNLEGQLLWQHDQRAPFLTGALTTAGGLLFIADYDRYISAFDVETGKRLWRTRAQTRGQGWPMSYAANGRQFVAIPVGTGAIWRGSNSIPLKLVPELKHPNGGNAIMVFALPAGSDGRSRD